MQHEYVVDYALSMRTNVCSENVTNCKHGMLWLKEIHVHVLMRHVALDLKGLPTDYSSHCTYDRNT